MRVDCRLLEHIFDRWNVNVHNEVMYSKHCLRVLTRGVLFLVCGQPVLASKCCVPSVQRALGSSATLQAYRLLCPAGT
jgi:hypothetical protein